jgi:hypothetical protein
MVDPHAEGLIVSGHIEDNARVFGTELISDLG